jgi:radical SAM superfamily enzyme YgiQ (UPF0313 family)
MSELTALRAAGLTKAYLGVETGDDRLLAEIKKGVTAAQMLEAGQNLVNADINLSSMVLLGIAGKGERSREHAVATAEITNRMKPQYLAALTTTPVPGTILYHKMQKGEFELPDPFDTLEEMKLMFENITMDNLKFVGVHASNYLPVSGTLQKDRDKMLAAVNGVLETRDTGALRSEQMRGL